MGRSLETFSTRLSKLFEAVLNVELHINGCQSLNAGVDDSLEST